MKKTLLTFAAVAAVLLSGCGTIGALPKPQKDPAGNNVLVQEGFLCYGLFEWQGCMVQNGLEAARAKAKRYCDATSQQVKEVGFRNGAHNYVVNPTSLMQTNNKRVFVTYLFRCE